MDIKIRQIGPIERADLKTGGICIVAGRNGAGKTSILRGIGATLAGAAPYPGITKADCAKVVRQGAEEGSIIINGDQSLTRLTFPKMDRFTEGNAPHLSPLAAGLVWITQMSDKDRSATLAKVIKATPTKEDLAAALSELTISEKVMATIWEKVEALGWDGAHNQAKETGAKLKGRWEQATGQQKWGSKIGANWRPTGLPEGAALPEDPGAAKAELEAAEAALKAAYTAAGADEEKRKALAAAAAPLADLRAAAESAHAKVTEIETELKGLQDERAKLPSGVAQQTFPCPHCQGPLTFQNVKQHHVQVIAAPPAPDEDELKKHRKAVAQLDGKISNCEGRLSTARAEHAKAEVAATTAAKAKDDLAAMPKIDEGAAGQDVTAAEQRVVVAKAASLKLEADRLHQTILLNVALQAALAPEGVRQSVMARQLESFHKEHLAPLYTAAKWEPVAITGDMQITYGGFPLWQTSESRRWRAMAVLHVALAKMEGAPIVILDGADILDASGRNGLFGMLLAAKLPAIIGMTANLAKMVPDLAARGVGNSYFIKDSVAYSMADAIAMEGA